METIWQKYFRKLEEKELKKPEYKVLYKILEEIHPQRWEVKLEFPNRVKWSKYEQEYEKHAAKPLKFKQKVKNALESAKLHVFIHFPEIIIKNKHAQKHLIRDLYVRIDFPIDREDAIIDMYGTRATASLSEYNTSYGHSHLNGSWIHHLKMNRNEYEPEFSHFCKGSSEFGCLRKTEFLSKDEMKIRQSLFLLQAYLEYESIEGRPYFYLHEVTQTDSLKNLRIDKWELNNLIVKKPPLKFNKELKITNYSEIEDWLEPKCNYKSVKVGNRYYTPVEETSLKKYESIQGKFIFNFRNQLVKFKLDNYVKESNLKKYCHPKYTKAVISYWERRAKEAYIREYRVKRQENQVTPT